MTKRHHDKREGKIPCILFNHEEKLLIELKGDIYSLSCMDQLSFSKYHNLLIK